MSGHVLKAVGRKPKAHPPAAGFLRGVTVPLVDQITKQQNQVRRGTSQGAMRGWAPTPWHLQRQQPHVATPQANPVTHAHIRGATQLLNTNMATMADILEYSCTAWQTGTALKLPRTPSTSVAARTPSWDPLATPSWQPLKGRTYSRPLPSPALVSWALGTLRSVSASPVQIHVPLILLFI